MSPTTLQRRIAQAVIAWQQSREGWEMVYLDPRGYERAVGNIVKRVLKAYRK